MNRTLKKSVAAGVATVVAVIMTEVVTTGWTYLEAALKSRKKKESK